MKLRILTPSQALNKSLLKLKSHRLEMENFTANLVQLRARINNRESEEFHKHLLIDFLKKSFYDPNYFINTKGRNDLVIHNGNNAKTTVGVIIEVKKPANKAEMISIDKINVKALQELVLYYLRERITHKNLEIKYLIATNIYEWFIFDAMQFDRLFAQDKNFVTQFNDFETGRLAEIKTDFFYTQIASPFMAKLIPEIEGTYFDLREQDDTQLIALCKLFSPAHLLKLPFANDSNSLDKRFYSELLHIIGLIEIKDGSKKLIERNKPGQRHTGSLLENAMLQLDSLDKISRLENPLQFGINVQEQLFNLALELSITWINRVLFLKLLEAQLVTYHQGNTAYEFLNFTKIKTYDDLNHLFFQVLARRQSERNAPAQVNFSTVPYLNSSLFEPTAIEHATLFINQLRHDNPLPIFACTVLKDAAGNTRSGDINPLQYLFEFLSAYNFASDSRQLMQEDNKTLINAAVLGLIFEKINGYKDGSFFTPGFITMYMCRETIRAAVMQKFKEVKGWNCTDINSLYNAIEDRNEANKIINSLRICDPAVGSGHFLVSALNEILAIKSDLKILQDRAGKRLKEYHCEVVNDELMVTDENGALFEYNPLNRESQRVQEALFHEKQLLIENCLFGVDINPNSVKICRLRLWIELLKCMYYKNETELETLPNIDINIKNGNSLISRFALDVDLKLTYLTPTLSLTGEGVNSVPHPPLQSWGGVGGGGVNSVPHPPLQSWGGVGGGVSSAGQWTIESYRLAVATYRNAHSKEQKWEMERLIGEIKTNFRTEISQHDPKVKRLNGLKGEVLSLRNQSQLFELSKKDMVERDKRIAKLLVEIEKLEIEIEAIRSNKIYENAFEWRFEFPEVLNSNGDFIGFDVVIGNPPYVFARENFDTITKKYFINNYPMSQYQVNLFLIFIEKAFFLLKSKGEFSLIVPNSFLMISSAKELRRFLLNETSILTIVNLLGYTFDGVSVETIIFSARKEKPNKQSQIHIFGNSKQNIVLNQVKEQILFSVNGGCELNIFSDKESDVIISKLYLDSEILDNLVLIKSGLKAYESGKGIPKQSTEDVKNRIYDYNYKFDETTYKYLEGKNVCRYYLNWSGMYLRYGNNLAAPRIFGIFSSHKIIIREITGKYPQSIIATYSEDIFLFNMSNIVIIEKEQSKVSLKYILAVLNSKLMSYYFVKNTAKSVRQIFPKLILEDLRKFPFKNCSIEKQQPLINFVEKILKIKQIDYTSDTSDLESKIDQLVYQLYGLTPEEIAIIESSYEL